MGADKFAVIGREDVVKALKLPTQIIPGYYWKVLEVGPLKAATPWCLWARLNQIC